jgi:Tfp pilus assembly protein PilF
VQRDLGELEAARATQQRALAIQEAVYGPEHPAVARTLGNLGNVQEQLGELEAAREQTGRALVIFERFLGPDHPYTRQARANLASCSAPDSETDTEARDGQRRASTTTARLRAALNRAKRRI